MPVAKTKLPLAAFRAIVPFAFPAAVHAKDEDSGHFRTAHGSRTGHHQPACGGRTTVEIKFLSDMVPASPSSSQTPAANRRPHPGMATRRHLQFLFFACVLLLATCPALIRAQSDSGKPAVEFCCVVWEPLPITAVFYRNGISYLPLELSPGNRSKFYPMREGGALELFEKEVGVDGATAYKPVGRAPLVSGARRMLFLVDPVANATGLPLRLFGVDDALDAFPPGTFRFFNFSMAELQVRFGGQVSKLPAGEVSVVKSNVSDKGGFVPFLIGDSKDEVVFETRLFSQPTGRDMVFIGAPARPGGRVLVRVLPQLIPTAPAKPKGQ